MNAPFNLCWNGRIAVALAEADFFVFPCFNNPSHPNHKKPLVQWLDKSTKDPEQVRAWWLAEYRNALPAIDLSQSGLIVVDGDLHHEGQDGPASLEMILRQKLPDIGCPVVVTPSGGVHCYFIQPRLPGDDGSMALGNGTGSLPYGIDIRGHGGYVIAPGAATGDKRLYRRLPGTEELIDAFHSGTIPYLPDAIVEAIRSGREDKRVVTEIDAPQPRVYTKSGNREGAWGAAALENELRRIADAPKGARNNVLAAKAFYLGTIAARGWIDPSAAIAGMMGAVKGWTDPKKTISTLNRCFTAGLAYPHDDLPDSRDDYGVDPEIMRLGREAVDAAVRAARDEVISEARDDGFLFDPQTGEILESSQPSGEEERALHEKWQERIREKSEQARRKAEEEFKSKNDNASVIVRASPFPWPDPRSIPPREFLLGDHLIRGFCSATVSPGGLGKSSLLIAEAASLITGRALLHNVQPHEPANVWIWNGEDPLIELYRRVAAVMKHYEIRREDCPGQLFIDSGRDTKIVIAEIDKKRGNVINRPIVDQIIERIKENRIGAMVVDPFVASHRVQENDNNAIDEVAREWSSIAEKTGCAIDLVHHVRKTGDFEVTVEMARGATSFISAVRHARVLNGMSKEEAEKSGAGNRRQYFRVNDGKANMSIADESSRWFRMESVDLENDAQGRFSDNVGVVTEWRWPDPLDEITAADLKRVLNIVAQGEWRENIQSKAWVGIAAADALGFDITDKAQKARVNALIKIWIKNGALVVIQKPDKNGDERPFVEVGRFDDE